LPFGSVAGPRVPDQQERQGALSARLSRRGA
jgi:hypothetical protein